MYYAGNHINLTQLFDFTEYKYDFMYQINMFLEIIKYFPVDSIIKQAENTVASAGNPVLDQTTKIKTIIETYKEELTKKIKNELQKESKENGIMANIKANQIK